MSSHVTVPHPTFPDLDITVNIEHFHHQPPDLSSWDSDIDYHGYTECDYEIVEIQDPSNRITYNDYDRYYSKELDEVVIDQVLTEIKEEYL